MRTFGCLSLLLVLLGVAVIFPPALIFVGTLGTGLALVIFFGTRLLEDISGKQ